MRTHHIERTLLFAIGKVFRLIVMIVMFSSCATSNGLPPQLTTRENHFFSNEHEMIYLIQDLPQPIAQRVRYMANPGEVFNATDALISGIPGSQLIWAATSKDLSIVFFRTGGFVLRQFADLYEMQGNQITKITRIRVPLFVDDTKDFQEYVLSGKSENLY